MHILKGIERLGAALLGIPKVALLMIMPMVATKFVSYTLFLTPYVGSYVPIEVLGVAFTLVGFIDLVVGFWLGHFIDTRGRFPGLLLMFFLASASLSMLSFMDPLKYPGYLRMLLLLIAMAMALISLTGLTLVFSAMISDAVPKELLPSVWGWYNSLVNLVYIVSPIVTGFIASMSYRLMFLLALVLHLAALLIYLCLYVANPEVRAAMKRVRREEHGSLVQELIGFAKAIRDRSVLLFLVIYSFEAPYLSMRFIRLYVVNTLRVPPEIFGLAVGVGSAVGVATPLLGSAVTKRIGYRRAITLGQVLLFTWIISYAFASEPWHIFVIEALRALTLIYYPARDSYLMALMPPEVRGRILSIQNIAFQLATIPAPIMGAAVWSGLGPRYVFIFDALIVVALAVLAQLLKEAIPKVERLHISTST